MRAPDMPAAEEQRPELSYSLEASCCARTNLHRRPKKTKLGSAAAAAARRPATATAAQTVKQMPSSATQVSKPPPKQQQQTQHPRVLKPRQALLRLERRLSRRPDPEADAFATPWALRQRARALDSLLAPSSFSAAGSRASSAGSCQLYGVWERVPMGSATSAAVEEPATTSAISSMAAVSVSVASTATRCRTAVARTTPAASAAVCRSVAEGPAPAAEGSRNQRECRPATSCHPNRRGRPVIALVDFVASAAVRVKNFSFPAESPPAAATSASTRPQEQQQQHPLGFTPSLLGNQQALSGAASLSRGGGNARSSGGEERRESVTAPGSGAVDVARSGPLCSAFVAGSVSGRGLVPGPVIPSSVRSQQQQQQQQTSLRPVRRPASFDRCWVSAPAAAADSGETPSSSRLPRHQRLAATLAINSLKS
ncbi:hypothetical protein BOX15_Mlig000306g3 [Macrostomum lignano]|uniref:Uncharacterized protein n=1 Tax=Macrostomum lignano TaxID=282301 RepID=A0A267EFG2_9PLAT|nr:hypothetical protein BOX15_Mlig000306g3 [Macrostomum lignano]